MRKSSAPSCQPSKRLKFISNYHSSSRSLLENNILNISESPEDITNSSTDLSKNSTICSRTDVKYALPTTIASNEKKEDILRSAEEILKLISEPLNDSCNLNASISTTIPDKIHSNASNSDLYCNKFKKSFVKQSTNCSNKTLKDHEVKQIPSSEVDNDYLYFNVMWCKRSSKKHKIWEGDGVLLVKKQSAVLKDMCGKIIDRGSGYKLKEIESLEEGAKFCVGSKECEIQDKITPDEYNKIFKSESLSIPCEDLNSAPSFKENYYPALNTKFIKPIKSMNDEPDIVFENQLVLPQPSKEHQDQFNVKKMSVVDVKIDSFLVNHLRHHQKEGIVFMYKCILGMQHEFGEGVILADEMGLGKTLQCIVLIWTLLNQGPYGGKPVLKNVVIITPSSLVMNWKKEFHKWLGQSRLSIFAVDKKNTVKDYLKFPKPVLIISYEMFLRASEKLSLLNFDLLICDEGHRIKNISLKTSNVINCLPTTKRILLTGTPIQNDLTEFFSIVDFVNPGSLGSIQYFKRKYEKPILQSRDQDCTNEEKNIGEEKSEELSQITSAFILRRTQEIINKYLPPKTEIVVFCKPTLLQKEIYEHLLNSKFIESIFSVTGCCDPSLHLIFISLLRKLCNHPSLLYLDKNISENQIMDNFSCLYTSNYEPSPNESGKMKILLKMLSSLFSQEKKEKIVIVSIFTKTLDIIENLCQSQNYEYLRLDGSTSSTSRQELVDLFNLSYTKYNVFLLSSKAGGVGFNLIGASRIVLYDIDWNPANDLQAMARIWRDGQKRPVYVYRLLTTGTIEEKIYQRQIAKQCLSGSVLNSCASEKLTFSLEELKDIFTFHNDTKSITHDILNCDCLKVLIQELKNQSETAKNIGISDVMKWNHIAGPISEENTPDSILTSAGNDITFLFANKVNSCGISQKAKLLL